MRLLLDTHLLLWVALRQNRVPPAARALIEDPANELTFSAANIWEVTIKRGLGRRDFRVDPTLLRRELLENQYCELAITSVHAAAIGELPSLHKDPFDRILVAQAIAEGMTLLTSDKALARYPGSIQHV